MRANRETFCNKNISEVVWKYVAQMLGVGKEGDVSGNMFLQQCFQACPGTKTHHRRQCMCGIATTKHMG